MGARPTGVGCSQRARHARVALSGSTKLITHWEEWHAWGERGQVEGLVVPPPAPSQQWQQWCDHEIQARVRTRPATDGQSLNRNVAGVGPEWSSAIPGSS
eukprot:12368865-Alexandrium_andersonii.AAC.1